MNDLFASFLDDYFAECDEHLTAIRQNLLLFEQFVNQPPIDRSLLDKLFVSFHSVKGLSAMVGLKDAERLAHEMESYLRTLRDKQAVLTPEGIDALINNTKMLEQVINAHRVENAGREETGDNFSAVLSIPPPPVSLPAIELKPEELKQLTRELANGAKAWQVEFVPGREKADRGINVNTIRSRLQAIGRLIHASPRAIDNTDIVFDFVIATHAEASTFVNGEEDGLTYAPYIYPETTQSENANEKITESIEESDRQTARIETPGKAAPPPSAIPSNVVRVDLTRLDEIMRIVGELVVTRARLAENLKNIADIVPGSQLRALRETAFTLEHQLRDLRDGVMRVRLVPIGELFARMQFAIRDLAKESQKQIELELRGQSTEIDKFLVDRTIDPLLHLVRNAVSHGLESEAERIAAGKPKEGKICLRASTAGEMVIIEVEDDGRGIDVEKVTKRAKEQELLDADATPDLATILDVVCSPGFSTREQADLTSGRGVGMAVVKNTVTELGGSLAFDTEVGRGTRFIVQLPLTLAIADALIVSVGGQTFAIPQSGIREVVEVKNNAIALWENSETLAHRGAILPLIRLGRVFNLPPFPIADSIAIISNGLNPIAIAVDRILRQQEIVVRPLTDPLIQIPGISGATELGDGQVVLIIDILALSNFPKTKIPHHH